MKKAGVLLLVLLSAVVLADIGPSPPKPDIVVIFHKDGKPYPVASVIYHCIADAEAIAKWGGETTFFCKDDVCRNEEWAFYKLSPCFYPQNGYFTYVVDGQKKRSSNIGFNESGTYKVMIDVDSGKILAKMWMSKACYAPTAMLAVLAFAIFSSQRK